MTGDDRVNAYHRWYCNSDGWAKRLQGELIPNVLRDIDLGADLLEIGPGPGASTDWLRSRVARVTSIEIDHRLAEKLKARLAGSNVTVIEGDATSMPLPDASFDTVVAFTMLHHVPARLHDKLLAEASRVLRPGGAFAGMDSTPSLMWNLAHLFDDRNPVDPTTFGARLEAAGFTDVRVVSPGRGFSWRARRAG
jgi:SAM-dependent methyltransferase